MKGGWGLGHQYLMVMAEALPAHNRPNAFAGRKIDLAKFEDWLTDQFARVVVERLRARDNLRAGISPDSIVTKGDANGHDN